jgi:hypothetical protein
MFDVIIKLNKRETGKVKHKPWKKNYEEAIKR